MRILHVLPSMAVAYGGPVLNTVAAAHAVQDLGAKVSIFSVDNGAIPQARRHYRASAEDLPANLDGLDVRLLEGRFPHRLAFSPALDRELRRAVGGYDVVHIHQLFLYPQFAAWRAATRANVPYVVSPRGSLDPYLRRRGMWRKKLTDLLWQRQMLDNAAAIHLTSGEEESLIRDLAFEPPHVVVPNGVDARSFCSLPDGRAFRLKHLSGFEGPLVMNHGRLSHKKGIDILIDAFAQVREEFPEVRLVLVGPDDEGLSSQLRKRARGAGMSGAVNFVGTLKGDDLLGALAAADVWVLPSHTENFGNAVVEAMAAGRPVVTSPYVNIAPEAHEAGALIMVDNRPEPVAHAIVEQLNSPERRNALGQRAREYAQRFDWSVVGQQYMEFYSSVIEQHRNLGTRR